MKIAVIGAGAVGSATAFALIFSGVAHKVILVDINTAKAEAEATDIAHAAPFASAGKIKAGTYADIAQSDIVIITAGANQKPGETRIDLLERNVQIFKQIIPQVVQNAPNCLMIIATNPADVMTDVARKLSGFEAHRVFGSGTVLDTARFRSLLAYFLGVSSKSVHANVLGEHGDSEVLIWSSAKVGSLSVEDFAAAVHKNLDTAKKDEITDEVVNAAYKIIAGKGFTAYGIAGALTQICRAVANNDYSVLTVSSHHPLAEGVENISFSLPTIVNRRGIYQVIMPKLSAQEHDSLHQSAEKIALYTKQAFEMM